MSRFTGEVAVVTGAASGIGAATARLLAREGAHVVLVDRDERGAEVARETGGVFVAADVAAERDWTAIARACHDEAGPASVLVSNAYIHRPGGPESLARADWDAVVGVNAAGLFEGVRAFAGDLRGRHGAIVATSSVQAAFGLPGYTAYAASKGAIESLARQLAVELAPEVRVNVVAPGPVLTGAWDAADDEGIRASARATAVGRIGTPEEVAAAIAFLASREASFITGARLVVDGGWSVTKDSP